MKDKNKLRQQRCDDPTKCRTVRREEQEEQEEEERHETEEEEAHVYWYWKGHGLNTGWVEYSGDICKKLSKAFSGEGNTLVDIDSERFVNLTDKSNIFQARFDNPAKQRPVKLLLSNVPSKKRKMTTAATKTASKIAKADQISCPTTSKSKIGNCFPRELPTISSLPGQWKLKIFQSIF